MGGKVVSPAVSVVGAAAGARSILELVRKFYAGFQRGDR
jgi:hypothetical protein